jgi:hypothetical protein
VALAAALIVLWLAVDPRTPDLAAQVYRVGLFRQLGLAVWDEHWYAGHHLPGYSLLFPPLGWLLGVRLVAALSVLAAVALFERLAQTLYGRDARWAAIAFAVAAVGDIWAGRLAFALGVPLAVAAALAIVRGRTAVAVILAALCAAASPVAGVLLALAGLSGTVIRGSPRLLLALAAPVAAVLVPLALLFPEGGFEPYPLLSFLATSLVVLAFLWALPAEQRSLRVGGAIYLLACLLAGPLLLCARPRASAAVAAALCAWALWVVWGPARETAAVAGSEATSAAYYAPVERFLAAQVQGPVRIELPLTRAHWEAALLAPSVSLARGWEKQLDERFDRVLLAPGLTSAAYASWLRENAVSYVALPDTRLDPSSAQEGLLIERGLPYLQMVFTSRHWRIYRVLGATPLASGPGRLMKLGHDSFTLRAFSAGDFVTRLRFTRYWTVTAGSGCVRRAPGGWTSVTASAPGTIVVTARFSLARAFSPGGTCGGRTPSS